jgi:hypothetical protein
MMALDEHFGFMRRREGSILPLFALTTAEN